MAYAQNTPRIRLFTLALLAGTVLASPGFAQGSSPQGSNQRGNQGSAQGAKSPAPRGDIQVTAPNFVELVERVAPAVVRVTVVGRTEAQAAIPPDMRGSPLEEFFRRFGPGMPGGERPDERSRPTRGQGSGFIIDASGVIVTNNHVVGDADRVTVELPGGRELRAKVIGGDPQTDIAVLKVESSEPLPTVPWGNSNQLRVGEPVLAMGNPYGLGGSATAGIVSARGRQIGAGPYDDFIQTDAPINPGNSGGPLFNIRGEVIGVNTAIFSPTGGNIGIGFAVPSAIARSIVQDLLDDGEVKRGWLGVSLQPLNDELARALGVPDAQGALIAGVEPRSPAASGGLRAGDVVTKVGDKKVEDPRDLATAVAEVSPGSSVSLTLLREGDSQQTKITLGSQPNRQARAGRSAPSEPDTDSLGLALQPGRDGDGAVVVQVAPGSVAEDRGMRAGDVILRVGGRDVSTARDVAAAVEAARKAGRPSIAIQVERGDARTFLALPLGERQPG